MGIAEIEQILDRALRPLRLEVRDESAKHAGHPGAASGGGHFEVVVVSEAFDGKSSIERHRLVYRALGDHMGRDVHALKLRTLTPAEWSATS